MHPDLMRSTGLGKNLKERAAIKFLNLLPTGDCHPSSSRPGGHPFPLAWMSSDGGINEAFFLTESSIRNGRIDFVHSPVFKLLGQMVKSLVLFGNNHDAGSILIQSVHNAWPQDAINPGEIFTMIKKGIDQCAGWVSISRMNDHARRLVNDDDGWVLIKDGEREGFWFERKGFGLGKRS
jgi:hypothetical protein